MSDVKKSELMAEFEPPEAPKGGARIEMGGQAVIEGVMMRSSKGYAIAVRKMSGAIRVKKVPHVPLTRRIKALGWPFVRGAAGLFEMMIIGFKTLNFSIDEWEEDFEEQERQKKAEEAKKNGETAEHESPPARREKTLKDKAIGVGMFIFSFALALTLVVAVPNLLTAAVGYLPGLKAADSPAPEAPALGAPISELAESQDGNYRPSEKSGLVEEQRPFLYNLISGVFRALIIFGYIWAISFMADVKRLFQYHGAEHKAVSAFEHGRPLNVAEVQPFSRLHPRCGTTFIFVVIVVSIIFFALIAWGIQAAIPHFTTWPFLGKKAVILLSHLVFMPLVAGTAYEILKLSAKYRRLWLAQFIVIPGFMFQRLTTREPEDDMVEVSIAALEAALNMGEAEETLEIAPAEKAAAQPELAPA